MDQRRTDWQDVAADYRPRSVAYRSLAYRARREIDTDERRVRQRRGDRQQVRPIAACKLEDPACRDGCDIEAEKHRETLQS